MNKGLIFLKNAFRRIGIIAVLFTLLVVPFTAFADSTCTDQTPCNTACPTTPPCTTEEPVCAVTPAPACGTETITFTNDTACAQHIKVHYRTNWTSIFSTHHLHIDLAPGTSYTFSYPADSIWSKYAKVRNHSYKKVQSGNEYLLSKML